MSATIIGLLFISIVIYALRVSWKGITKPYDKSGVDNYFANKRKDIPKPFFTPPRRKKKIQYVRKIYGRK